MADSASSATPAPAASGASGQPKDSSMASTSPAAAPTCVAEGDWQPCSVEKRLTDAGLVPIKKGQAPSGLFPVGGTTYALGPAELHVYVFTSAKAREQAVADVDTVTVARRGTPAPSWPSPPTFISSNNLVAILVSDNDRMIERVQNAIRAGLPAASR